MLILAALATLGAQAAPAPSSEQFAVARRLLNETMLDFPSARFRDVHGNAGAICGFVNGKNRLGAFTGWKRFGIVFFGDQPSLYTEDAGSQAVMLDTFCGPDGMKLAGTDYSDRLTTR